jgi:site-specific recombinase XerD
MIEEDLLARFEEHLVDLSMAPATIANYLGDVRGFCTWLSGSCLKDLSLLGVNADHVRRYCRALRLQGRSASTVNRHLQAVRKFYDFVGQTRLSSYNPARDVERLDEHTAASPHVLTNDEVRKLLCAVGDGTDSISRRDRAVVHLLLDTGIKVRELIDLRVDDLDLAVGGGYLLVGHDLQSGGRCLALGSQTCAALRAYMRVRAPARRVDHLFVNRQGLPLSARSVHRLVASCARIAGLEGVSAHTLRYTFAHDALVDKNPSEVAQMLGLRDVTGVRRYRS